MRPDDKDMARLWDILEAARTAVEFTKDLRFEEFLSDKRTRYAVERSLEIVGEAARCVSLKTRDNHPDIPWSSIIGLRNIITHDYGEVLYENIWRVCKDRLPPLVQRIEEMGVENLPTDEET